jgi:tetratricopeptide (TPR) repeat protein
LAHLQQEVDSLFADWGAIPDHLLAQQQASGDPTRTADTMRRALDNYFYDYPDPFIRYVQAQFDPQRLAEQFGRELLRDEPARTAFQLLLLQTVEQQTAVLLTGQQALSADVQEVRDWLARWQATPPEQQHTQFEAALTAALDRIAGEIKAHTTAEHEKTRAFIAEQVQPTVTFPLIHLPPPNPHFVGRTEHLDTLTAGSGQTAITQTISGLGGVGKSQLMLHFAHRQRDGYDIIWWLRVDEALAEDLLALGRQLRLPVDGPGMEQAAAVRLVRNWLNGSDKRWLLLCDNADKMEPRDLRASLPTSPKGRILITSRNPRWRKLGGVLQLDVFTPAEAAAFWQERLDKSGRFVQSELAELAQELGYQPLALEQAAAYIDQNEASAADSLRLFQTRRRALWATLPPPDDYHATIATTWEIGFAEARQTPGAADLLHLCCFLAPAEIPLDLLVDHAKTLPDELATILADPLARNAALTALERYALLTRSDGLLTIHRLVQTVARDRLEEAEAKAWAETAVNLIWQSLPDWTRLHEWQAGGRVLPHMTNAVDLAAAQGIESERLAALCNWTGYYLHFRGEYAAARPNFERALAIREKALGPDLQNEALLQATATSLNNLGYLLQAMGDLAEARPYYERALAIWEKALGPDHPDTATSLNNLAVLCYYEGDKPEAARLMQQALAIREARLGPDHPNTQSSRQSLAVIEAEL